MLCKNICDIYITRMSPIPPPGARITTFSNGIVWIDDYGFCRIRHTGSTGQHMGIPEVIEMGQAAFEICDGKKRKHLVDLRGIQYTLLPGAREAIRNNPHINACRSACACIVDAVAVKLVAELFIQVNKPPYPYQVFTSEEDAINWLNSINP